MALTITEIYADVQAPGTHLAIERDGILVGTILFTGLPGALWNLYTPGRALADGVEHAVCRLIPGEQYTTREAAEAAAYRVYAH